MSQVSRTQPSVSQVRDTAVVHLENIYSESSEKLLLYCLSCLLSAIRLYLMCLALPHGPALLWPTDKAPRALSVSGSPAAGCLLIHTGIFTPSQLGFCLYRITLHFLQLTEKCRFLQWGILSPWAPASNMIAGRSSLSPWTTPGICGDPTAQPATMLGDIPLLLSPCLLVCLMRCTDHGRCWPGDTSVIKI